MLAATIRSCALAATIFVAGCFGDPLQLAQKDASSTASSMEGGTGEPESATPLDRDVASDTTPDASEDVTAPIDGDTAGSMSDAAGDGGAELPAKMLVSGELHSCVLLTNGRLKCWGASSDGQLGQGDTVGHGSGPQEMGPHLPAVDLGANRTVQWIAAGGFHTCALLDKNELKCWGFNFYGQLGLGDTFDRGNLQGQMGDSLHVVDLGAMRSAVSIGASEHTCAVLDDKSLKCWGDNNIGQLGQGDHLDRGDDPGEMGDNLAPISLGDGRSAVSVAAAYDHTCAILDGGDVKCWGANSGIFPGELGLGDNVTRGNLPNQMGNRLPVLYFGLGHNATAIAAGQYHTCVILEDSQVKCWGRNESGELGYGDKEDRGAKPTDMGDNLPEIDLGKDRRAVSICAGSQHTCALLDHAQVKCWGKNDQGQLGQGDTSNRGDDAGEMGDNLPVIDLAAPVTSIACGVDFNCALLEGGRVKCWGHNRNGTLGLGDTTNRGDAMGQMGVNLPYVLLGN